MQSFEPRNIAKIFFGCLAGLFIGAMPGLGSVNGVAILLPVTFLVPPTSAIIFLAALYYGAMYGGAVSSITLGIHPIHYMGSMAYHNPPEVRKLEIIGGLFGEPYRVAECAGNGIEVPEGAEIVIEGEILANTHEPEGPFGEFTGYASYRSTENVFVAKRVSMRKDAILHSVASGTAADHILISSVSREAEILNTLQRNLPNVLGVHVPIITAGGLMTFYCKCVVVVDDDVDIFNLSDVMWAVITRTRADTDFVFIPGAMGAILDPTSDPEDHTLTKLGVDATKPSGRDFAERLTIANDQRDRVRGMMERAGFKL